MAINGFTADYNSYTLNNVTFSVSHSPIFTDSGTIESYARTYEINTTVKTATRAAMTTAYAAIRAAYDLPGQTLTIKDSAATTLETFGPSDVNGNGPNVSYSFPSGGTTAGYNFQVSITVSGNTDPGGSGTLVDDYSDNYVADATGRWTWTRNGDIRTDTAWDDQDAAMIDANPNPSGSTWELLKRNGKLDQDKKSMAYTFTYIEPWETKPSNFGDATYTITRSRDFKKENITLTATVKPIFDTGSVESIEEEALEWASEKLPENTRILTENTVKSPRDGSATVTITGVRSNDETDILEESETEETAGRTPFVIQRPMDASEPWADIVGAAIKTKNVSGRLVGLSDYPAVPSSVSKELEFSFSREPAFPGIGGETLYPVSYTYTKYLNLDTGGGGGGGGNAGVGGGGSSGWGGSGGSPGKITVGEIGSFSGIGLKSGGMFGQNAKPFKFSI